MECILLQTQMMLSLIPRNLQVVLWMDVNPLFFPSVGLGVSHVFWVQGSIIRKVHSFQLSPRSDLFFTLRCMKDGEIDWGWGILISAARKKLTENNSVLDDSEPQWVLDVFLPCDPVS